MNAPASLARQQTLIAALRDPARYPHPARQVQLIETHISWVLLAGRYAYKIKKALNLGFLDYGTLTARHQCCEEEIRLNRRLAPHIYLDTVAIGGQPDAPVFDASPAIEYAVRMRRFAAARLMDNLLTRGRVMPSHIDALAATLSRFHASLPPADGPFGDGPSIHAATLENFESLHTPLQEAPDHANLAALRTACDREYSTCASFIEQRRQQGFVRECHGDLHLGNIALIGARPVPFDGIEFNPALRWIDVMSELAFTMMDLLHRDRADYAWRFLNACLENSGDYAGLRVLRYYLAYRALVRAKVCALRTGQPGQTATQRAQELAASRSYLSLANDLLARRRPVLILTHGLPGSGKTTFSQLALERLGAIRLRSDVERKRLFGLAALDNSRTRVGDIYDAEATRRTYEQLLEWARTLLSAGYPVIVDAAFLKTRERRQFRQLAQELALPCTIVSLQASDAELRQRIVQRHGDASEADLSVLDLLMKIQEPLSREERKITVSYTTAAAAEDDINAPSWSRLRYGLDASRNTDDPRPD
jgi:hypothetical protein